ncbi:MAG: aldehyde ferredoxin oxidoreductase N-terminal domain-containing protein [Candidatus Hodarchaeales archaeon]|jgi:aldehyde:ferredoxin oxidoreductase
MTEFMWTPQLQVFDLTEEKLLPKKPIEKRVVENFLGGRGITVYLGYHSIPTDASPRGQDNAVILGTGTLTGTLFPSSGMIVATFKSPQTNTLFTSIATGHFGASLKYAGFDFFQITGCAKDPRYILIDEFSDVTLEDAKLIWKKSISESDNWLRQKHGNNASIATISTAAVNQIAYAGVAIDRVHFFRRGGLGAVLASKNIKALVITEPPEVIKLEGVSSDLISDINKFLEQTEWYKMLQNRGTFSTIFSAIENKVLPAKNCSRLLQLAPEKINAFRGYGEPFLCWQCPVKCQRNSYQDFVALGPNLKIVDLEKIQKAIETCDHEALDPLSTGAALGSLFNIQEDRRKLLDINLGFNWGNQNIYSLIQKIVDRKGIGDQLARGERYLYQQTSEPSPMIKNQIGGMFYYPNILGLSLATSISPYGANNFRSSFMIFPELLGIPFKLDPQSKRGKVRTNILLENSIAVLDSLVICSRYLPMLLHIRRKLEWLSPKIQNFFLQFFSNPLLGRLSIESSTLITLLKNVFNEELNFTKIIEIGNRITLLERIFNTRTGMSRSDDCYEKFLKKRLDFHQDHEALLREYYNQKGLTLNGMVQKKTLGKMGLLGLITI